MSERLRVGIVGVAGYTGAELVRLVHAHPRLDLVRVGAASTAGQRLEDVLPGTRGVRGVGELMVERFAIEDTPSWAASVDVAFCALPHGASASIVAALYRADLTVVDLSADYRLQDPKVYAEWYGEHPEPGLLADAVYGLPELHRDRLRGARLIAAPGCYPTAALLALAPLLRTKLVEPTRLVIDSKSGVSGAGKTPSASTHFSETSEGVRAYKVAGTHRHTPEIEQELSRAAGTAVRVTFTPHLVPMTRGIFSVAYAAASPGASAEACRDAARAAYDGGLVSVLPAGKTPDTLHVRGSVRAQLAYELDVRTGTVLAFGAIDNLTRGASGQALTALNVSRGWDEALGLPQIAQFP